MEWNSRMEEPRTKKVTLEAGARVGIGLEVELSLAAGFWRLNFGLNSFQILLRYRIRWIQLQCDLKLLECFIQFPQLCEGDAIIQMRARKVRANVDHFGKLRLRFFNSSFSCQFASQ